MAGFLGNQPPVVPMTSADIVDGTVTADDLNSTLNLSSKTVTLPASSVTSHVTSFDDSDIRSDILKLALHQAIDGNRVAYNLEDSFVDGFEDSSGIDAGGNLTNVVRDTTSEYVSSIYSTVATTTPSSVSDWAGSTAHATYGSGTLDIGTNDKTLRSSAVLTGDFALLGTPTNISAVPVWLGVFRSSDIGSYNPNHENGPLISIGEGYLYGSHSRDSKTAGFTKNPSVSLQAYSSSNNDVVKIQRVGSTLYNYLNGTLKHTQASVSTGTMYVLIGGHDGSDWINLSWEETTNTANATGTLISDPQTASTSRTSASGVIIYEDAAGTNTLGTDLKIYFSCDNSAWTEAASYGTATTYSGTKKLVKLGATTCTAGTSIAMKAVWANQSASKEARLHGWAVNY